MNILSVAGCAVILCVLAVLLKQQRPEFGVLIAVGGGVLLISLAMAQIVPPLSNMLELLSSTAAYEYVPVVVKAFSVCVITHVAADICRDNGQSAVASGVEMAGRAAMFVLALPILSDLMSSAIEIING